MAIHSTYIRYKITIEKLVRQEYDSQSDILVEERHYTDKEVEESHRWMREREDNKDLTKKIYGKKEIIAAREDKSTVYEQVIEDEEFELKAVIAAINDLKA